MSTELPNQARSPLHVAEGRLPGAVASPPDPPQGGWSTVRPLLLRLHFYAGILVAPFLLVAATTGLAYTLTPAIEHVAYAHELRVPVGQQRLALDQQVDAARAAHPEGTVTEVRLAESADGTTRVVLDVSSVPGESVPESYSRTVFVDPYTGEVRGALTTYGEWLPIRAWVDELHRNLHLGEVGRVYSELAASWMWVIVAGGLALWIGRRRQRRRHLVVTDLSQNGRRRTLSWHGTVGIWATTGLLFLSATGLTWSHWAGDNIGRLRAALAWETPSVSTALDGSTSSAAPDGHAGHGGHDMSTSTTSDGVLTAGAGLNGVLAAARGEGLRDPLQLVPPAAQGEAWTVKETKRNWPSQQDAVAVDGATGRVVAELRFADYPVAAKLTRWGVDAHMGLLFGTANLVALAALALAVIVLVVWGYRMWWQRRPDPTRRWSLGPTAHRGAWRSLPWPAVVLGGALTLGLVLALPVFGASLLLFLLADLAMAAAARVRGRRSDTGVTS